MRLAFVNNFHLSPQSLGPRFLLACTVVFYAVSVNVSIAACPEDSVKSVAVATENRRAINSWAAAKLRSLRKEDPEAQFQVYELTHAASNTVDLVRTSSTIKHNCLRGYWEILLIKDPKTCKIEVAKSYPYAENCCSPELCPSRLPSGWMLELIERSKNFSKSQTLATRARLLDLVHPLRGFIFNDGIHAPKQFRRASAETARAIATDWQLDIYYLSCDPAFQKTSAQTLEANCKIGRSGEYTEYLWQLDASDPSRAYLMRSEIKDSGE